MKTNLLSVCALFVLGATLSAAEPSLQKLWETDAAFKVPESVLYDPEREVLFVANIEGEEPWANDGAGSIGKLSPNGEIIEAEWVTGLNAPKGMGIVDGRLYVTDVDDVVRIDIDKGQVVDRLAVPDAGHINDLSVAEDGTVYVTDSQKGSIFSLINGKFTKVVEGQKGLNGVLHSLDELLFVANGALRVVEDGGSITEIASGLEGHADGVERVNEDAWLVSGWAGTLYYVTRDGRTTLLKDTRSSEINAADIGYNPSEKIVYVPTFWKDTVVAYRVKTQD